MNHEHMNLTEHLNLNLLTVDPTRRILIAIIRHAT